MSAPSARVIADSISPDGHRLTTIEATMHRFVLAEANTHRVFSRNSASSRAIPLRKQIERVIDDLAVPVDWPSEHPGMQGGDEISEVDAARTIWLGAADDAVERAKDYMQLGVHKSVANRLLEPFLWHTVIVTSTSWGNFFRQRCSPLAQREMRAVAEVMREVYGASEPRLVGDGLWHLPYIECEDIMAVEDWLYDQGQATDDNVTRALVQVSTARCARVSYLTHDGKREITADLDLYRKLVTAEPMHASPLEHVAAPEPRNVHEVVVSSRFARDGAFDQVRLTLPRYGNLLGWHSHRFDVEAALNYQAYS